MKILAIIASIVAAASIAALLWLNNASGHHNADAQSLQTRLDQAQMLSASNIVTLTQEVAALKDSLAATNAAYAAAIADLQAQISAGIDSHKNSKAN